MITTLSSAQHAMIHVARVLQPIAALCAPLLGKQFAFTPAYCIFFFQIFCLGVITIRYFSKINPKSIPFLGSCVISTVHAAACIFAGWHELSTWRSKEPLQLDAPNTPIQNLQLQFSLAYLFADTFYFLAFDPNDLFFIAHHALAGAYLFGCLKLNVGGISAIFVFFMGEITTPLFNIFSVAKSLRQDHPFAGKVLNAVSPFFTASFILVRSIISPVLIGWFLHTLYFSSPRIPAPWRAFMCGLVTAGMAGSQVWSYKLFIGYRKERSKMAAAEAAIETSKAE